MAQESSISNNREELINSNDLLLDHERTVLKKYFNSTSHNVQDDKTDPLKITSFGEPPTKLTSNGVWVGNFYDVHMTPMLQELRIQCVINVMGVVPNSIIVGIPYILYPLPQPQNGEKFDEMSMANAFNIGYAIEKLRAAGYTSVFVHCLSGIDRGPTIVWKYMVDKLKWKEDDARNHIKKLRPISNIHSDWF